MGYSVNDLVKGENSFDGSLYCSSGMLYFEDKKIVAFYEHPIEGGYYQNGEVFSDELLQKFLELNRFASFSETLDDCDAFHKGISKLIRTM